MIYLYLYPRTDAQSQEKKESGWAHACVAYNMLQVRRWRMEFDLTEQCILRERPSRPSRICVELLSENENGWTCSIIWKGFRLIGSLCEKGIQVDLNTFIAHQDMSSYIMLVFEVSEKSKYCTALSNKNQTARQTRGSPSLSMIFRIRGLPSWVEWRDTKRHGDLFTCWQKAWDACGWLFPMVDSTHR